MIAKSVFTILMSFLIFFGLSAQTKIAVVAGMDFLKMQSKHGQANIYTFPAKGFDNKSFAFGIQLEKALAKKFGLSLLSFFTTKYHVEINDSGIVGHNELVFNYFRTAVQIDYKLLPSINLSGGPGFTFIPQMDISVNNGSKSNLVGNVKEFGFLISAAYQYHRFIIKTNFYQGTNLIFKKEEKDRLPFRPSTSIGFLLGYQLFTPSKK